MTRRVFDSGTLLEEWDDDALIHGSLDDHGVWQTRPYAEDEKPPDPPEVPDPLADGLDDLTVALLAAL